MWSYRPVQARDVQYWKIQEHIRLRSIKAQTKKIYSRPFNFDPDAIALHFKQEHALSKSNKSFVDYLSNNLFVFSVGFRNKALSGSTSNIDWLWGEFGKIYFQLSRNAFGSKLNKKRLLKLNKKRLFQPLTYAFVDFEGSRSSGQLHMQTVSDPHLHGLMLVRDEMRDRFSPIQLPLLAAVHATVLTDFHVRIFDPELGLDRATKYAMKGFKKAPAQYSGSDDLWRIFPK